MSHTRESQPTDAAERALEAGGAGGLRDASVPPISQAAGTPGGSRSPEEGLSVSLNGCAFSSGGGTPEEASKAKLVAFRVGTGREAYTCAVGARWRGGRESGGRGWVLGCSS